MTSTAHLAFFLLFACCVTVEDNFSGVNSEEFSQNGPSYTYEINE